MNILILGGTQFLGRHLVESAINRGHQVILFNRGQTNPDLFPGLETVIGDRTTDLSGLDGKSFDWVIDVPGRIPSIVRHSAGYLTGKTQGYAFISSLSVYADMSVPGIDENGPLQQLPDPNNEELTNESYGGLKVLCEQVVQWAFPNRALIIRPGLIVGPYDPTDRFTYWPLRIAKGGEVLAPGKPGRQVAFIDARDLSEWIISLLEANQRGIYNALGPNYPLSFQQVLDTCRMVSGSNATFTWVDEKFLLQENVEPWSDLPLWIPDEPENAGFYNFNIQRALNTGLKFRPLAETVQDILAWAQPHPLQPLKAGLSFEREQELLRKWAVFNQI